MNSNKFKIDNIYGRIRTINNIRHCNIYSYYGYFTEFNTKYRLEKYDCLSTIINNLQNIHILTINIKDGNTLQNIDKQMVNLSCLLKKLTFRLCFGLSRKYNQNSFNNFNFVHELKIPYDCKIEFKYDNITFEVI